MAYDVPFRDPTATIVRMERSGGGARVTVDISGRVSPPLFPASLLRAEGDEALHLDRLISEEGDEAFVFETFAAPDELPVAGATYIFRPWWTPDALELVTDTTRQWVREQYPDNGGHDHCPLTWETIAANAGDGMAYRSGNDWISTTAYEKYIRDDHLRVRGDL